MFTTPTSTIATVFSLITGQLSSFKGVVILVIGLEAVFFVIELLVHLISGRPAASVDNSAVPDDRNS